MKIVILDGFTENPGDLSWSQIERYGDLTVYDRTPVSDQDEIINRIGNAEIVFTNKTPIKAAVMDACPSMQFIGVLATGYNVVDVAHAKEKGIPVCNIPGYGTAAVAQFAIGLLLEVCHHIGHHSDRVHDGAWQGAADWCFWDYPLVELEGKTLGIIGFGRIGQRVGRIARALGMKVIACSRSRSEQAAEIGEYVDLDMLLKESDVISLHCPLFPETEKIINKNTIAKMKDGVIIINNGRGQLIDEQDLADALNCGKVAGAGLDVLSCEPPKDDNPLLTAENCIITPHISWASREARQRIMDIAAANLEAFLQGSPQNVVNS